jgi:hypothetical protein
MIGRPGYAPQDLLKLYIYRVRSGRHLEAETHRIEVIWLLRHLKPTSRPGRFSMGRTHCRRRQVRFSASPMTS